MKTVKKGFSRGLSILLTLVMVLSLTVVGMVSTSAARVDIADSGWYSGDNFYVNANINSYNDIDPMTFVSEGSSNVNGYFTQTIIYNPTQSSNYFDFRVKIIGKNGGNAYIVPKNNNVFTPTLNSEVILVRANNQIDQTGAQVDFKLNCYQFIDQTINITIKVFIENGNVTKLTFIVNSGSGETTTPRTFEAGEYIYIKNFSTGNYNWILDNSEAWAYLWLDSDNSKNCSIKFERCDGTGVAGAVGTYYRALVTPGTYDKIIFTRNNSGSTGPFDDKKWNQTGSLNVHPTDNCYYGFSENGDKCNTEPYDPTGGGETTTKNAKVYINPGDQTDLYAWIWDSKNTQYSGVADWPGKSVTSSGTHDSNGYYVFEVNDYTDFYKIIISKAGTKIYDSDTCEVKELTAPETYIYITGGGAGDCEVSNTPIVPSTMWIDVVPNQDYEGTNIDRIYPTKKGSEYIFYLPSSVDINYLTIKHNFDSLIIDGNTIDVNGTACSYNKGTSYNLGGALNNCTVKFYQSANVAALYTYTKESMPTTTMGSGYTKSDYNTTGSIMKIGADGNIVVNETPLKSIKGRGNSSWEASAKFFGKYAYNIALKKEAALIDGAKLNKKYSLLANNMDESRMRNMVIYNLATEVGVKYTSKFETFDVYNNGLYMGSYLLAEKVEVGDPLVKIDDLEDINKSVSENNKNLYDNKSQINKVTNDTEKIMYASNLDEPVPSKYQNSGFLLEFEYHDRYSDEFSGFISTQGQRIVCKSPEYATKKEIEFIRDKWNAAEAIMYKTNSTYKELDDVIDVESFAKMYLIQELSKNLDAACTSYYVYYDGGKFHAGVAWDYDWTLGQYGASDKYKYYPTIRPTRFSEVDSELSVPYNWHVNSKKMDKHDNNSTNKFNAQAQLCQNTNFWKVVAAEWNENFYSKALSYTEDHEIDSASEFTASEHKIAEYYNTVNKSVNMDEERWGIIEGDILTHNWGSVDTGDSHDVAAKSLHNWYFNRLQWMHEGITGHTNSNPLKTTAYTIQPPVITFDKDNYNSGENVTLTIKDKTDGDYTYTIYNGSELVKTTKEKTYTFTAGNSGTYSYTVTATSDTGKSATSDSAAITITGSSFAITKIEYPSSAEVGTDVVITVSTNTTESVTYTLYGSDGTTVKATSNTGILKVKIDGTPGDTLTYTVKAHLTSDPTKRAEETVSITVTAASNTPYKVVLYFKSSDSYGYRPLLTTTGAENDVNRKSMERDQLIRKNVTQTATYSWYKSDELTVPKSPGQLDVNVLSKRYPMNGNITLNMSSYSPNADGVIEIYLACDNLNYNAGGEIRDLTSWPEEKRNWTQSVANMIYDEDEVSPATYAAVASMIAPRYIGDVNNDGVVNVKDATLLQKSIAGTATLDADSRYISDVFYDGTISVKDATAIQKRVVNL